MISNEPETQEIYFFHVHFNLSSYNIFSFIWSYSNFEFFFCPLFWKWNVISFVPFFFSPKIFNLSSDDLWSRKQIFPSYFGFVKNKIEKQRELFKFYGFMFLLYNITKCLVKIDFILLLWSWLYDIFNWFFYYFSLSFQLGSSVNKNAHPYT